MLPLKPVNLTLCRQRIFAILPFSDMVEGGRAASSKGPSLAPDDAVGLADSTRAWKYEQMIFTQLSLMGQGPWPDLYLDRLNAQTNVLYGGPQSGKSTVGKFVVRLLNYLLQNNAPRSEVAFEPSSAFAFKRAIDPSHLEGSLQLDGPLGHYVLRCHHTDMKVNGNDPAARGPMEDSTGRYASPVLNMAPASIAIGAFSALDGIPLDSEKIESHLASLRSLRLSRPIMIDFSKPPRLGRLLFEACSRRGQPDSRLELPGKQDRTHSGRASEYLAQLTSEHLVEIRVRHSRNRKGTLILADYKGRQLPLDSLTEAQYDQLVLALVLSLIDSDATGQLSLPLVLDEPFLRQDQTGIAAMARVLDSFARENHQLLVLTEDRHALREFDSLGTTVHRIDQLRRQPSAKPITSRVRRKSNDRASVVRIIKTTAEGELFYLNVSCLLDDFPVLGSATMAVFARLGINTVGQLMVAEPRKLASRIDRSGITSQVVAMWQAHIRLICFVPEVTLQDAQLLTALGFRGPGQLAQADGGQLQSAVRHFLANDASSSSSRSRIQDLSDQLAHWQAGARKHLQRWDQFRAAHTQAVSTEQPKDPGPAGDRLKAPQEAA
jgi:uncharacterized protein DUF4332